MCGRFSWMILLLVALSFLTGCTRLPEATLVEPVAEQKTLTLNVFAAASLTDAFAEIGENFHNAHPEVDVVFNFAGSNQLATQIKEGAPADLFASANELQMDVVLESGHINSTAVRTFAQNRLVLITPHDNPAALTTVADLAKPGIAVVFAAAEVPVGQYTLTFLAQADAAGTLGADYRDRVLANVVSYEANVRAVLTKVMLGEADAGIVYSSDVGAGGGVIEILIPDAFNTVADYPIAPLLDGQHVATAELFIDYVLSAEGQQTMARHGFIPITPTE